MKSLAIVALTAAVAGCVTPYGAALQEARARCAVDSGPRWSGVPPKSGSLVLLGTVEDPATTGGQLVPKHSYLAFGGLEPWLTRTPLTRVDVFIKTPVQGPGTLEFGPRRGEPSGVYAYEEVDPRSPRCPAEGLSAAADVARSRQGECVSRRFVGPLDIRAYDYVQYVFWDEAAERRGVSRMVEELRTRDGTIVARAANYSVGDSAACGPFRFLSTSLEGR